MDSSNAIVLPEDKLQTNRKHAKNLVWYVIWMKCHTLFYISEWKFKYSECFILLISAPLLLSSI
jgi:hypothetical protein